MTVKEFIKLCIDGKLEDVEAFFKDWEEKGSNPVQDLSGRDDYFKSALDYLAMTGKNRMLKLLADKGFDINAMSGRGYTPLHHAACWGQLNCLKELYLAGADLSMVNVNKETAKDCAIRYGHKEARHFLDIAETQTDLKNAAKNFKDMITDPEKHMGRLSKEEKITGSRACDEKMAWVEFTKETASLSQIRQMKAELLETMRPIMAKLEENYSDPAKGGRSHSRNAK